MGVKVVIFDNDGCFQAHNLQTGFGDPEDHYYAAFEAVALVFNKHLYQHSSLREQVKGLAIREVGRLLIEGLELPLKYEEWKSAIDQILLALAPFAEICTGGEEVVRELCQRGKRVGVASSSVRRVLERKWERFPHVRQLFFCFVAGDDERVQQGKPAPDLLLAAAQDISVNPSECAYVGDTRTDMTAAKRAGMLAIAFNEHGKPDGYYRDAGADIVITTMRDLLIHIM